METRTCEVCGEKLQQRVASKPQQNLDPLGDPTPWATMAMPWVCVNVNCPESGTELAPASPHQSRG